MRWNLSPALNIAELGAVTCWLNDEIAGCSENSFAASSTSWPKSYLLFLAVFYLLFIVISEPVSPDLNASDIACRFPVISLWLFRLSEMLKSISRDIVVLRVIETLVHGFFIRW